MATYISHSPAETAALGATWGCAALSGLVIGLCGDLGAGKTQLVKGLARGLGIVEQVLSPTFVLVNVYTGGRLTLCHLDLYRLETREQIVAAGLEDYLKPAGVTVIEWAERWFGFDSLKSKVHSPQSTVHSPRSAVHGPQSTVHGPQSTVRLFPERFRQVWIEVVSDTERRITYEDSGA
jgi:tRNA threonylcarbamoyladenosine biosynthesis protein TsaE